MALTALPGSSVFGTTVTVTATVTPSAATGKVTFYDGTAVLGTGTMSSGQAVVRTTLLAAGSHSLTARYLGDPSYAASLSPAVTQTVTATAAGGFQPASNYTTSPFPNSLATGDFNGDGKTDLAAASNGTVSILLGNNNGTFGGAITAAAGLGSAFLATGDFNGDGKLDLALVSEDNNLTILLGKGDGTFLAPTSYSVGNQPRALAVGDLNRDGNADVIVANQGDNQIAVLLGRGDGTFQTAQHYAVGTVPGSIAIGDFDADGKADVVVGNFASSDVSLLRGNGDGTLQAAVSSPIGGVVISVVAGDFNGDGKLDVAAGYAYGTAVLLGIGDGTFQTPVLSSTGNYSSPYVVGDFNGDGKLDLAVPDYPDAVAVLIGNGDGSFQPPMKYRVGTLPTYGIVTGEFNGDGRTDLAVANYQASNVSILLGQAGANPTVQASSVSPASGSGAFQIFSFQFTDSAGASDLAAVYASIGSSPTTQMTCAVTYNPAQNTLALLNDSGAVQGTISPGSGTQQNSRCTLSGSQSSVTIAGNLLTMTVAIGFQAAYAGAYTTYGNAISTTGSISGWTLVGSWTVSVSGQAPQVSSVSPASGAGPSQTFTVVYNDVNGAMDLSNVLVLVNASQSTASACSLSVDPIHGLVSLANDGGTGWLGPIAMGVTGTLQNSQCWVDGHASGGAISGTTYTLQLALSFSATFPGAKNVYGYAASSGNGLNSGWRQIGTWTVSASLGTSYLISTFASGQLPATTAQATAIDIGQPFGLAVDTTGNVYFETGTSFVFKLDRSGLVTRVAGTGVTGYSGDNGPALNAQLGALEGLAVDSAGNLYISDTAFDRVRKVAVNGTITTVAGNGSTGFSGDNGPATSAQLDGPRGVAVDSAGNLYIADSNNNRVRKVSQAGIITTVAGSGVAGYSGDHNAATSAALNQPYGVAVDGSGNLYIADANNYVVREVVADGTITTVAGNGTYGYNGDGIAAASANIGTPASVTVDAAGNLYIGEIAGFRIRVVNTNGMISTFAGTGAYGYNGDGGVPTSTQIYGAAGLGTDGSGALYFADLNNQRIRKISGGTVSTVAGGGSGDGGAAFFSGLLSPDGLASDSSGNIYAADVQNQRIRKITPAGLISTIAGTGVAGYSGDNGPALGAQLNSPNSIATDAAGNLYVADTGNSRIRKISTNGMISTVAGSGFAGYSGDNGAATNALLNAPEGIAVDGAGNLFIADTGNHVIRKVNLAGAINTVAGNGTNGYSGDGGPATGAQLSYPQRVAADLSGNFYIVEFDEHHIRKVSSGGTITTFAGTTDSGFTGDGGAASSAELSYPEGVAVDSAGNVYIMDSNNGRIREVTPGGFISTIAGNGSFGTSGDGGTALNAGMSVSTGCVDSQGRIYFAAAAAFPSAGIRVLTPASAAPLLSVTSSHIGRFTSGFTGQYTLTVSNAASAGPTSGTVTVTELLPSGLTMASMSGTGWTCGSSTCTRSNSLSGGAGYPPINVVVNVLTSAPAQVTNQATVSGGGAGASGIEDLTLVNTLIVHQNHNGIFTQGQTSATYTVTVTNPAVDDLTFGTVTVTETVPTGLTLVSMSGASWSCPPSGNTCTRTDSLAAGASYPPLTVTVNVSATAPSQVVNQVTVSGGGAQSATALDTAAVYSSCDAGVTTSDVQAVVNEALGATAAVDDMNHDGVVNVVDVQKAIIAALGKSCMKN